MRQSVAAGVVVDVPSVDTLSDGTAGGIEPGSITLSPCMRCVDVWATVTESEIAAAMRLVLQSHSKLIEGAAGVSVACFLKLSAQEPEMWKGRHVAIIICGGNVSSNVLKRVLAV